MGANVGSCTYNTVEFFCNNNCFLLPTCPPHTLQLWFIQNTPLHILTVYTFKFKNYVFQQRLKMKKVINKRFNVFWSKIVIFINVRAVSVHTIVAHSTREFSDETIAVAAAEIAGVSQCSQFRGCVAGRKSSGWTGQMACHPRVGISSSRLQMSSPVRRLDSKQQKKPLMGATYD